jgi:hypothetical protein
MLGSVSSLTNLFSTTKIISKIPPHMPEADGLTPLVGGTLARGLHALPAAAQGQPVHRDLHLSFQTRADCLRALTSFREAVLTSFTQQSFAGMFTLTGTVVSVWRNPDVTGIRRWWPWNYQAVRVNSACQEIESGR